MIGEGIAATEPFAQAQLRELSAELATLMRRKPPAGFDEIAKLTARVEQAIKAIALAEKSYGDLRAKARAYLRELDGNAALAARVPAEDRIAVRALAEQPALSAKAAEPARGMFMAADHRREAVRVQVDLEQRAVVQLADIEREIAALPAYHLGDDGLNAALRAAQGLRDSGQLAELRVAVQGDRDLRRQIKRVRALDADWQTIPSRLANLPTLGAAHALAANAAFGARLGAAHGELAYRLASEALYVQEILINTPRFTAVAGGDVAASTMLDTLLTHRTIRAGEINKAYRTNWDPGLYDFSIEITVQGIRTIVIHAHCKRTSATSAVAIGKAHWKLKDEKFQGGRSHPISDAVEPAMVDRGRIESYVKGRTFQKQ